MVMWLSGELGDLLLDDCVVMDFEEGISMFGR